MKTKQKKILMALPEISNDIMQHVALAVFQADFLTEGSYEILHKHIAAISSGECRPCTGIIKSICRIVLNEKVLTQIEKDYFKKFIGYEEV